MNEELTTRSLVMRMGESLSLSAATGPECSGGVIRDSGVSLPGLFLAGFADGFHAERVQVLSAHEVSYVDSLEEGARVAAFERLCAPPVPCIIVTDGQVPPARLVELGNARGVSVLATPLTSERLVRELVSGLEDLLAPQKIVHGTLVDVNGVGLLFTGKSGIGKSECGLDLVANGHRLVADDAVCVMRTRRGFLVGYGSELLQNYMEIRGVGIIDVQAMFGTRAFRQRKRIEVEVKLAAWSELSDYERLGFEDETSEILGVEIPAVTLPLVLGKNITVISEVIALNYLLKLRGINAAKDFDRRQRDAIARQAGVLRATQGDDE
ncbi:MAG: HPr(Ser) kinase/phosphatase [Candidatus Eisenbacteria bacterium]